ncbi:MAG TPA: ABC transporter ATP-binding protein [Pseudolabrys sp.]|nr:ABC transporter ATP-binding protein [Pseudolabrys sp.]
MNDQNLPSVTDERYSALALIRRLLTEQGLLHWRKYATAFVLMAVAAGCTALPAYLVGDFVNQAYIHRSFPMIAMLGIATMVVFMVKGFATYGHMVILSRIGNRIVADNQQRLFDKLLTEQISFFADRHSSEFAARLTAGTFAVNQVLNQLVTALGRDLLTLVGLVGVMFIQEPLLSLVTLIVVPPAMLLLRKMIRRIRSIARAQFTGGTRILETMQETVQGMPVIKAFTLEEYMRRRFAANVGEVEQESNKMARVANRSSPLMEMLGGIAIALAVIYGGYRVIAGATPGEFFSFITAFLLANEPAKRIARLNIELNSALVNVRTLFEILDAPATEPIEEHKPALTVRQAGIEFSGVDFAYRKDEQVLHALTLSAEPGKVTALVGPSGGGKSTIFNLLLRFYETDKGKISIDAQNIAEVSRHSVRQAIGYVGQNIFLFRGTVCDNIAFGKPDATEQEIIAAAKAAYAHDFIMAFPRGYETPVGEHGLQLSGGQRQRVAIARALIKNAPIILLDEATAALDAESEGLVQEALAHLTQGRTTMVIAHRLQTVTHADRIYVIENGTAVESGHHDELLRRDGRYTSFYRLQFKNQEVAERVIAMSSAG